MTYAVFAVIFGSIIYYAIVFISEVFGYTPKCIQRMCTSKKLRHAIKEKDGLGDLKVQNMTANPLSTLQLEKMAKEETNRRASQDQIELELSPMQESKAKGGKNDFMKHYHNMRESYQVRALSIIISIYIFLRHLL